MTTFAEPKTIASVSVVATANTRPRVTIRRTSMNSTQIIISVNLDLPLFFRVAKLNGSILYVTKYNQIIDAQSFSNYFEGVLGVVRKSDRVSSIFNF